MKHAFLCGILVLIFLSQSCSHYVGLADPPTEYSGVIDTLRQVFLKVRASDTGFDNYAVWMTALRGRNGPVISSIPGALLYIDGSKWKLGDGIPYKSYSSAFRYDGYPYEIVIGYVSPEKMGTGTKYSLGRTSSFFYQCSVSRSKGFEITVSPKLRDNELLEVTVYSPSRGFTTISKRSYREDGAEKFVMSSADFINEIRNEKELSVEVTRTHVTQRQVIFSDGIEFTQVVGPQTRYVKVTQ